MMPAELVPNVRMLPSLATLTVLPLPAAPPEPPTALASALSWMLKLPAIEKPPVPPPPPIDCARMPADPWPVVTIEKPGMEDPADAEALTVTWPASLLLPPAPPTALI